VRQKISYSELLRDIRTEKVKEVSWFTGLPAGDSYLEGPCLVIYKDGTVKQSCVPSVDRRIPFAMESHKVVASLVPPTPREIFAPAPVAPSEFVVDIFSKVIPFAALLLVYAAATYAAYLKGDAEDRKKLRQKDRMEKEMQKMEEKEDVLANEATTMALMGVGVEEICTSLDRLGVPYERADIEAEVENARKKNLEIAAKESQRAGPELIFNSKAAEQAAYNRQAKKDNEDAEKDQMEEAEQFLKMSTVKVQKAKTKPKQEELRQKMRAAQRRMKGVNLQYMKDETVLFDDVAGIGAAKEELMEVVDFFLKPERFRESGSRIPKGVLLCGPPGTGKTLLARAVAGEAGVAFLSLNASEFVEMFVGVGASRVRDLFSQARALAPAIVFIDEIDAVGRIRGGAQGNDERDQTLNQMLSEMDGFDADSGVIVMAATNRKDVLDPALIRPGRFDRIILVDRPDFNGRIDILKVHLDRRPYAADVDLRELAFETQRFSGAQLANLVNTASMIAGRDARESVTHRDLEEALDLERLGPKRRQYGEVMRRRMAVQEAATGLVCTLLPAIEPVLSISIIPREQYPMGQTVLKVNEARELNRQFTRRYLEEQLLTVLAGRAAEELTYGFDELSSVNQRRLVTARRIVTKLVVSAAMTDNPGIGPRTVSVPYYPGGRTLFQIVPDRVSGYTHEVVEGEMYSMLNDGFAKVKDMLARNRTAFDKLVQMLLEKEEISGDEVRDVLEELGDAGDLEWRNKELEGKEHTFL